MIRAYLNSIEMKFLILYLRYVYRSLGHVPAQSSETTMKCLIFAFLGMYVGNFLIVWKLLLLEEEIVVGDGHLFSIFGKFNKNRHGGITNYEYQVEV